MAPTGTGKTAAFVLPILQRLSHSTAQKPRVLILEPTRELAERVHQTVCSLGGNNRIRSVSIYGGVKMQGQLAALRLRKEGFRVSSLQGDMTQNHRQTSIDGSVQGNTIFS